MKTAFVRWPSADRWTSAVRRTSASVVALFVAALVALTVAAAPVAADPSDSEGATASLRENLAVAAAAYNNAKAIVDASRARQAELDTGLRQTELRLTILRTQVEFVANAAYRGRGLSMASALLSTGSPDNLLQSATTVQLLALHDDAKLREYNAAKRDFDAQKKALAAELKLQEEQLRQMDKRKADALKALQNAGGGAIVNGVPIAAPSASQAPRHLDGSWPTESCSIKDPTTSGCVTPRMLHAYNEARIAGFTRHSACFRHSNWGEHPKGRACDFSANASDFLDAAATGGDFAYGTKLAGWFIGNATRLGVLYVIWYRRVWTPGLGWRAYSGSGSAAASHTNHVHLSVQ
jgi:peptidoglycan DL-endopeptidase CwlO